MDGAKKHKHYHAKVVPISFENSNINVLTNEEVSCLVNALRRAKTYSKETGKLNLIIVSFSGSGEMSYVESRKMVTVDTSICNDGSCAQG